MYLLADLINKQIIKELSFISLLCEGGSNTTSQGHCKFGWYNMLGGVEAGWSGGLDRQQQILFERYEMRQKKET